ncbi:DUF3850 domain-containing protein [Pseudomonas sp. BYT-5]|uniref:DUF3850 domain-containing protein n=1 Tax=unclassified Pseudomonas TaxID=196821 RepID=UPI0020206F0F|nr:MULTISPECIES: DUF3850 domain-containing protein [unclassified Pseudomonas]URD40688.1 DUF3850 domain-containing protein [Pseudomonas sp. BYT-5]URK96047.1 DUF3850 domain-containing protein [Pseudomonas sp. BYT-1]
MPTENRSSNTERVSVPREHELKIRQTPLADLLSGLKTGEIRDCSDREFAVGDTVLLREIDDARDYTGTVLRRTITHVQKNYGLPDHLCVLSYGQPAEQPQGEPVGTLLIDEYFDGREVGDVDVQLDTKACEQLAEKYPGQSLPLYICPAPTDPGEVDQLSQVIRDLNDERDEIGAEVGRLRAQLAERDALLAEIAKRHWSGVDFDLPANLAARIKALSASAAPSAPVERDERATTKAFHDWAFYKKGEAIGRMDGQQAALEGFIAGADWQALADSERRP